MALAALAAFMLVRQGREESPARAVAEAEDGAVLLTSDGGSSRRVPPPGKGLPTWEKAPCEPPLEAISGYCWGAMDPNHFKPPCLHGLYEHAGRCLAPVVKVPRSDSSIQR